MVVALAFYLQRPRQLRHADIMRSGRIESASSSTETHWPLSAGGIGHLSRSAVNHFDSQSLQLGLSVSGVLEVILLPCPVADKEPVDGGVPDLGFCVGGCAHDLGLRLPKRAKVRSGL